MQAGAVDLIQIDAARVGGVNENIAILLLATKFAVRVFPHVGPPPASARPPCAAPT